jgi:hypothetical protein
MGQTIEIRAAVRLEDVLVLDTDRSLTGQEGESYGGSTTAQAVDTDAARLADRLFQSDPAIDHVFISSNTISVRRRGGWDDGQVGTVQQVVSHFFRIY